ncbi:hypothetical protein [Nocardioides sp. B-3]|uniref:hypothetical protein n=1 Tax=Nocardioides sp. B-3 TaxID=2895565 RepID=UPI002152714D|nr:hypothetical protein [Nocardioides sp. B-3]UUZ60179.1 hypothetical protein LP418_04345 [Nocardioides sp. B-3]
MMYCELVCAAQNLGLHDRAGDWTQMMEQWRHGRAFGGIHGRCRVHRAELLRISGPMDVAEDEAPAACSELRPWMRRELGWPLVELGIIRMRRGDLQGAEEAFLEAHDHAWSPQPRLALLRLEQGDLAAATAMVEEAVAHPPDLPWKERPPFGDLRLVPLPEAQAEIAAASGDLTALQRAATALAQVALRVPAGTLPAAASTAAARPAPGPRGCRGRRAPRGRRSLRPERGGCAARARRGTHPAGPGARPGPQPCSGPAGVAGGTP